MIPRRRIPARSTPAWTLARAPSLLVAGLVLATLSATVQRPVAAQVPTPASILGFVPGTDRELANWSEMTTYYSALARASNRVVLDTLGSTTDGRPFVMLTVTSPDNHDRIDELHDIQMRLADPRGITGPREAARLVAQGRTVVLITHGIHATEVGSAQSAANLAYRLASSNDPVVREILDNVILLQIPSLNPDGMEWVVDWYRRWGGTEYEAAPLPWLYHRYVGHDNNRDWYAFTQAETQLTIEKAHNAWHPQIVHDIHQMGGGGARIFFPPYIEPWDPNIDPGLTTAVNQLGTYMAAELTAGGKSGVVVQAIYDAYTPARAYQHYHAGARILSETASADLATPVEVDRDDLGGGRGYDAASRSWNYPWPWEGGRWGLPDIVDYMESGAMALLTHAARNRSYWLQNFLEIGERAITVADGTPEAWVIAADPGARPAIDYALRILAMGDVEVHRAEAPFTVDGNRYPAGTWVIPMRQPYASFVQTLLERQVYPDLREYPGGPPRRPYDVTAHTLPLLFGFEAEPVYSPLGVALSDPIDPPALDFRLPPELTGDDAPRVAIYKGHQEPMEAGWTRWVFDQHGLAYDTLHDATVRAGDLNARYDVILLQDQSPASISQGFAAGRLPDRYVGGLGDAGLRALRDFVRNGGRLVAIEEATDLAIDLFDLGISNAVERMPTNDFYIPGSLLGVELEDGLFARGLETEAAGWFWRSSRAFDVRDPTARVLARYGDAPLLSGWALGPDRVAGRPALVEVPVGRGSVTLFGFQPNYRGQSMATWPLLFRALAGPPQRVFDDF
ncbi:MAG: hypothetical protein KJO11_01915 [Gemmatimonadetes bacterium]|nr:hypothetical protein [Gemmatimonadota bacterium]